MMLDMNTIGYFLFMSEEEKKAVETQENRSVNNDPLCEEERPRQKTSSEENF